MMDYDVKGHLRNVLADLPQGVRLVAISKYHPNEYIQAAYDEGQLIGHLQTNKVKYIAPYITMIEAVDSFKLLKEIDKQAEKCGRVIDVLLEVHIAEEATKYGFPPEALRQMLSSGEWRELKHVRICGLMMMASNVDNEQQIRSEFTLARSLFLEMKTRFFADEPSFCERSWGMSHDYKIAVEEGSTMVRIGTTIFGPRVY